MGKVSIGLRGWRFDEEAVFTPEGELRPIDEMPQETRDRVSRLTALVGSPCDACWLVHGDEERSSCNTVEVVYGEPLAEVLLCADHEPDFLYWFNEVGGDVHRGEPTLQDAFHEWFADGGRAPADYDGIEHVDTDPDAIPRPSTADPDPADFDVPAEEAAAIDLRDLSALKREE